MQLCCNKVTTYQVLPVNYSRDGLQYAETCFVFGLGSGFRLVFPHDDLFVHQTTVLGIFFNPVEVIVGNAPCGYTMGTLDESAICTTVAVLSLRFAIDADRSVHILKSIVPFLDILIIEPILWCKEIIIMADTNCPA